MLEILHFIFSSFWVWLGSTVMLAIIVGGLASLTTGLATIFGGRRG